MRREIWITLDFALATVVAILGNIVASYLQEHFDLMAPFRFVFVAILFIICLGILLFITLRRPGDEADQDHGSDQSGIRVLQRAKHIKREGRIVGVDTKEPAFPTPTSVDQEAEKVAGEMTGVRIGQSREDCSDSQEG